ncbi:MAG: hypothetical protein VX949_07710 [Planctomycetota bacterium]|nr:hypothetical protein [Planctomycetota bacterium]
MSGDTRLFGEVAFEMQRITTAHLYEALALQARDEVSGAPHRFLGQILIDLGYMTDKQVLEVLEVLHGSPSQRQRKS